MGQGESTCAAPTAMRNTHRNSTATSVTCSTKGLFFKSSALADPEAPSAAFASSLFSWMRRSKRSSRNSRSVALQVAFERQTLKPVFHLIGYRLLV
jgi:hypothetical protein